MNAIHGISSPSSVRNLFTKSALDSRTRLQGVSQPYVSTYVCMYVAYGSGTITVFFRLTDANLFYPAQCLSSSLFCAISAPILLTHLCSSSPVLPVSTSQLVWTTFPLLLLSHVHIVSILLSAEREFCRNIFSNYVMCEFLPLLSRCSTLKFQ
jgi:hypothetical protein